jgi:hypothetical protein
LLHLEQTRRPWARTGARLGAAQEVAVNRYRVWTTGAVALLVLGLAIGLFGLTQIGSADRSAASGGRGLLALGVFGLVAGVGFLLWTMRRAEADRIQQTGEVVTAEVVRIDVRSARSRGNDYTYRRIRYRYLDRAGTSHEGWSGNVSADEARAWKPGDMGEVRYDPARPSRSVWVGRR